MTLWQARSKRKITGGRRRHYRKKRKFELGSDFDPAVISKDKNKTIRIRGGNTKTKVMGAQFANIFETDGSVSKVKIDTVLENPANPNYVQRNILTKGAIVSTKKGNAKITSRPGQDGVVNAILLEE